MNRIDLTFKKLRSAKKKAFIAFITAGDPSLKATEELALAFERSGVNILELGVPFSDPMADGPTIQAASFRALKRGVTLRKILSTVRSIRERSRMPIALMTYYNPVFHFGEEKFVRAAKEAGVDGLIIPDLPVDEAGTLCRHAKAADIATIFFLAPTTAKERMPAIVRASTGFIYFVSGGGVTGAKRAVPDVHRCFRVAKTSTKMPIFDGLGVADARQVRSMGCHADCVIGGSAIVKEVDRNADRPDMAARVSGFVKNLSAAL
ncbi:MAG: tryptophan synthase subunit alpha [Candidatus Omnitrophica bacterium]|nr:tryptophan synthase subunit alpha [Candidatus Omnitrophota bacterium]